MMPSTFLPSQSSDNTAFPMLQCTHFPYQFSPCLRRVKSHACLCSTCTSITFALPYDHTSPTICSQSHIFLIQSIPPHDPRMPMPTWQQRVLHAGVHPPYSPTFCQHSFSYAAMHPLPFPIFSPPAQSTDSCKPVPTW